MVQKHLEDHVFDDVDITLYFHTGLCRRTTAAIGLPQDCTDHLSNILVTPSQKLREFLTIF
ncbi:MAG: hypothetical protein GY758_23180 [Fuerstiella sp.]|nr:hypothetical protein [Fuerstiella sp.]